MLLLPPPFTLLFLPIDLPGEIRYERCARPLRLEQVLQREQPPSRGNHHNCALAPHADHGARRPKIFPEMETAHRQAVRAQHGYSGRDVTGTGIASLFPLFSFSCVSHYCNNLQNQFDSFRYFHHRVFEFPLQLHITPQLSIPFLCWHIQCVCFNLDFLHPPIFFFASFSHCYVGATPWSTHAPRRSPSSRAHGQI
jgi:hypothetical protein